MIRYYIYDRSGALVNDPEQSQDHIVNARWDSRWPGGHGTFSGTVYRHILHRWAIKTAYEIVVRDGQKILYQGRLASPAKQLTGLRSFISLTAHGYLTALNERTVRKRWVDATALSRLRWPPGREINDDQNTAVTEKRGELMRIVLVGDDTNLSPSNQYHEQYTLPGGDIVYQVDYEYVGRTGQGYDMVLYNDDQAATENTENVNSVTPLAGTVNHVFTQGDTGSFTWICQPEAGTQTYDQNDWVNVINMTVYSAYETGHSAGTPNFKTNEIVEDVLLLSTGSGISTDLSLIEDPNVTLAAFTTENDGYETATSIMKRLAAYADSSQNTWGFNVWDSDGASDDLPRAELTTRDVTDYDYIVNVSDLASFKPEETDDQLYNWVTVKWIDEAGVDRYLSPDDDSDLQDSASISDYGERHAPTLDAGYSSQTYAKQLAQRFLAYHKDPLEKMSLSVVGVIRNKRGIEFPVSWVRAGNRIKVSDYEGGKIYFLRQATYTVNTDKLEVSSDVPPDNIARDIAS